MNDSAPVRESTSNLEENSEDDPQEDQENSDLVFEGFVDDLHNFQYETDSSTSRPVVKKALSVLETASQVLLKPNDDLCAFGTLISKELGKIKDPRALRETKRQIFNWR